MSMNLINYRTGEIVRAATISEAIASLAAARAAGHSGAIDVDGVTCYVDAGAEDAAAMAVTL